MRYARSEMLFGDDFKKLQNAKILLLGVGGVGSVCLDCLVRTGITDITIVDYDTYDETNQNRQMWSELHLGESKVEALKKHYPSVTALHVKVDAAWVEEFDFQEYDLVLDAIDDTQAKLLLAHKCHKKLISSVGSAQHFNTTNVSVASIWQPHGHRSAAKIRA